jgi:hypothetical protein
MGVDLGLLVVLVVGELGSLGSLGSLGCVRDHCCTVTGADFTVCLCPARFVSGDLCLMGSTCMRA